MQFKPFARYAVASAAALAGCLLFALPASAQVAVTINGGAVDFSPPPIIQAGRVFVPLRGVFEQLGATVVYSNGTINATGNGRNISLQIGSTQATINGQPETIDVAPFIIGASTFVPLRFVSEALGASVNWDNEDRIVSIATVGAAPSYAGNPAPSENYVSYAPPPIPVYEQPYLPAPNYIWQPGYWGWGAYGYYWVPGTWVEAPQPGYLWTPGYWAWNNGGFAWNQGYWAVTVGFYGGVNYGAGYFGHGYVGGLWQNNVFRYNTYVTRVDTTIVTNVNVYEDRNVYVDNSPTRISYNGGPHGLQVHPTQEELIVAKAPHLGLTPAQQEHVQTAAQDRRLLATVNHDSPPVTAVAHPLSASNRPEGFVPVSESDKVKAPAPKPVVPAYHAPAVNPVAPYHAPAVRTPLPYRAPAPALRTAPPYHAPPVRTPLPYRAPAPALRTAPPYHAPPVRTPLPYRAPGPAIRTPVPYHPPVVHTPAPYHAPPKPHVVPKAPPPTEKPEPK
jgi:hypothetical protein